jgi:hypothetical protein
MNDGTQKPRRLRHEFARGTGTYDDKVCACGAQLSARCQCTIMEAHAYQAGRLDEQLAAAELATLNAAELTVSVEEAFTDLLDTLLLTSAERARFRAAIVPDVLAYIHEFYGRLQLYKAMYEERHAACAEHRRLQRLLKTAPSTQTVGEFLAAWTLDNTDPGDPSEQ